jgi:hypothetical protein
MAQWKAVPTRESPESRKRYLLSHPKREKALYTRIPFSDGHFRLVLLKGESPACGVETIQPEAAHIDSPGTGLGGKGQDCEVHLGLCSFLSHASRMESRQNPSFAS